MTDRTPRPEPGVNSIIRLLAVLKQETGADLEIQQLLTLSHIAENPGVSLSELVDLLGGEYTLAAISRNVARLSVDKITRSGPGLGLVVRYEDIHNRRIKRVKLTPRGERVFKKALLTYKEDC